MVLKRFSVRVAGRQLLGLCVLSQVRSSAPKGNQRPDSGQRFHRGVRASAQPQPVQCECRLIC